MKLVHIELLKRSEKRASSVLGQHSELIRNKTKRPTSPSLRCTPENTGQNNEQKTGGAGEDGGEASPCQQSGAVGVTWSGFLLKAVRQGWRSILRRFMAGTWVESNRTETWQPRASPWMHLLLWGCMSSTLLCLVGWISHTATLIYHENWLHWCLQSQIWFVSCSTFHALTDKCCFCYDGPWLDVTNLQ